MTVSASVIADALIDADLAELGRRIRVERMSADMTQRDLADPAGVSSAYVSRIEDGARRPRVRVLMEIANTLGVSPLTLLGLDTPKTTHEPLAETLARVLRSVQRLPVDSPERAAMEAQIVLHASKAVPRLLDPYLNPTT